MKAKEFERIMEASHSFGKRTGKMIKKRKRDEDSTNPPTPHVNTVKKRKVDEVGETSNMSKMDTDMSEAIEVEETEVVEIEEQEEDRILVLVDLLVNGITIRDQVELDVAPKKSIEALNDLKEAEVEGFCKRTMDELGMATTFKPLYYHHVLKQITSYFFFTSHPHLIEAAYKLTAHKLAKANTLDKPITANGTESMTNPTVIVEPTNFPFPLRDWAQTGDDFSYLNVQHIIRNPETTHHFGPQVLPTLQLLQYIGPVGTARK